MKYHRRGFHYVLGLLLLGVWVLGAGCGVIRTHAVVDRNNDKSMEADMGLDFFQKKFKEVYPDGFELGGFRFNFSHTVDFVEVNSHAEVFEAWDRAVEMKNTRAKGAKERSARMAGDDGAGPHFLLGTDDLHFAAEEIVAQQAGRLMVHATAPTVLHRKVFKKYFYAMVPQHDSATESVLVGLLVKGISHIAIIRQKNDLRNAVIADFIQSELREFDAIKPMLFDFDAYEKEGKESAVEVVSEIISNKIEVVVGCTSEEGSKQLIDAFWEKKYALRAQFYTFGPNSQAFLDALGPKAHGVLASETWHYTAVLENDGFFGTPRDFMDEAKIEPSPSMAAAAAAQFVLMEVFKTSFKDCDISKSGGDVDKMLFNSSAISCSSGEALGYDRILQDILFIDIDTIVGPVSFGKYGANDAGTSYVTQVHGTDGNLFPTVVLPPYLSNTSLPWRFQMPWPNPFAPDVCAAGSFTTDDAYDPCQKCSPGTVTEAEGSLECHRCPPGYYQPSEGGTLCFQCPENTNTLGYGAISIENCTCYSGYFNPDGQVGAPCEPCPYGADCMGGIALPIPERGFWKASGSAQIHYCDECTKACPGGGDEVCAVGYGGRICSQCEHGYYKLLANCFKCRSKLQVYGIIIGVLLLWYLINSIISLRVETVELTLNWAQLANIIGAVQLDWPGVFQNIFSVASILDFDIDIIQPNCILSGWSFRKVFIAQLIMPLWMSSMAFGWYFLCVARYKLRKKHGNVGSWVGKLLLRGVPQSKGHEWIGNKLDSAIARTLAALEVTYITTARYCVTSLRCEDVSGVQVLASSYSVECGTREHKSIIVLAVLGLTFYTAGYLAFTSLVLFKLYAKKKFSDTRSLHRYGFIYERFELGYAWTAVMMLVIRILFVISIEISTNPLSSAAALALITIIWLLIHVYTLPYVEDATDILQTILLVSLMALGYAGVMFSESQLPAVTKEWFSFWGASVIFLMVGTFVVLFCREVVLKIMIMVVQTRHKKAVLGSLESSNEPDTVLNDLLVAGVDLELYKSFKKQFIYDWLKNADKQTLMDFDRMSVILRDYLGDDSYLSFLSLETVARFWRKLVKGFPEIIDYLATADDEALESFSHFVDVLYRDYFLHRTLYSDNLHTLVEWKDHAPLAQWLLICPKEERKKFADLMAKGYEAHSGNSAMFLRAGNSLIEGKGRSQKRTVTRSPSAVIERLRSLTVKHRSAAQELSEQNGPLQHHTPIHKHQRTLERMKQLSKTWRSFPSLQSTSTLASISEKIVDDGPSSVVVSRKPSSD